MGLLLIVSVSVGVVIWAVSRHLSKRDRWLANLTHYEYAEWTRGYDGAYWPHSSDRDAHGGSWGVPGSKLPKERNEP